MLTIFSHSFYSLHSSLPPPPPPPLGYVQGMSDLLSPLLAVMENEVDTFWCFVGLMKMVGHYFEETQEGMRWRIRQLRALLSVSDPSFYKYLSEIIHRLFR